MQNVILTFFSQPTDPPLKTSNVEHAKFIKCVNPFHYQVYIKNVLLLYFERYHALPPARKQQNPTAECNDSGPVVYQTKRAAREI